MLILSYLLPRIVLIVVCVWGISLGFRNWSVDRPAAKLVISALMIRLVLLGWGPLQLLFYTRGAGTISIGLQIVTPMITSVIEATIIALLAYAVFRGRPGANLWPFRSR